MDTLEDLYTLIDAAIEEEPPITVREGGIIKDGYHEEIDRLREAKSQGKNWLAELEAKEREKTGIKNLKIKFNKVFGYYLEVTNSFKRFSAGLLYQKTDLNQCRALYHTGTQRDGGYDLRCGG